MKYRVKVLLKAFTLLFFFFFIFWKEKEPLFDRKRRDGTRDNRVDGKISRSREKRLIYSRSR